MAAGRLRRRAGADGPEAVRSRASRFLEAAGGHKRANILFDPSHFLLQQLDYAAFIDLYHDRIKAFHVKDAEFRPNGRCSRVYGGYQGWLDRPGRFRSPGDGQIDFTRVFFRSHMIRTTPQAFDDFAASSTDPKVHARIPGLDQQ